MKKTSETILFFGSGPVAAKSLSLLAKHCSIEAVITKPSTVKQMADALPGVQILAVDSRKALDELVDTRQFHSHLGVLVDFGIIVSRQTIDHFPLGIINSHFSLLPQWRGADPISFSILSGQCKTGVSLMLLVEAMDEGQILSFVECTIQKNDTTPTLTNTLIELSDELLKEIIPRYVEGNVKPISQAQAEALHGCEKSYSRKLTKEDAKIDWGKSATQIEREIRAFLGWPRSKTSLCGKDITITQASVVATSPSGTPSDVIVTHHKELGIICGQGTLVIKKMILAGKKEMSGEAFLAGHRAKLGL